MPLYNKAPHVRRSISSVLEQTFEDFELIVINDASTDGSLEEAEKFSDPRILIFHRGSPGLGGYAARNLGIEKAHAGWLAFLDADDKWYPAHLEKMKDLIKLFPDIYFLGCGWQNYQNNRLVENAYFRDNKHRGPHIINLEEYLRQCLKNRRPVQTSAACIKKSSPVASALFPAGRAMRGGDLHAWRGLMCRHKKMAWSSHIGAIYFRDSINMVTASAVSSANLMTGEALAALSENLSAREKNLLKKLFNKSIRTAWANNVIKKNPNFNLFGALHWSGDFLNALGIFCISFFPKSFIKFAYSRSKKPDI